MDIIFNYKLFSNYRIILTLTERFFSHTVSIFLFKFIIMGKIYNTSRWPLTAKQKLNIVYSAYGSLSDFSKQIQRPAQVARELNMIQ